MADDSRFAVLRRAARIWAVAAIHGEAATLARLHDALAARFRPGDRLVYLGNYLGHGGTIRETVDELLRFRRAVIAQPLSFASDVVYLRGAQEEMWQKLLQLQFATNPTEVLSWMVNQGVGATVVAYGGDVKRGFSAARDGAMSITRWTNGLRAAVRACPGHEALLAALRRAAVTDDHGLLFVHAGLNPDKPLDRQGDSLWWGAAGFDRIAAPYAGYRKVVRGFDKARQGLVETEHTISLDAGCGFGGGLLAGCLTPAGELVDHVLA